MHLHHRLKETSRRSVQFIAQFMRLESSSGILLFIAAVLALLIANSPLRHAYFDLLYRMHHLQLGHLHYEFSLIFWINDLLMAVFFLVVALEIKREIYLGELNSLRKVGLPAIAALGGMVVPALIFYAICCNEAF